MSLLDYTVPPVVDLDVAPAEDVCNGCGEGVEDLWYWSARPADDGPVVALCDLCRASLVLAVVSQW